MVDLLIEESWKSKLEGEFKKDYFLKLNTFLISEKEQHLVYPPSNLIFEAFNHVAFKDVKVVILGQDPYHGEGQANGFSFSVPSGVKIPPSLRNIFKELQSDCGRYSFSSGNLLGWAKQGVLLLNSTLTVRAKSPGSHQKKGWEHFTDAVIDRLSEERENLVFLLWGNYAQQKGVIINESKHLLLKAAHPSPFSAHRGFFKCKHFSKTNEYLNSRGLKPIDWDW